MVGSLCPVPRSLPVPSSLPAELPQGPAEGGWVPTIALQGHQETFPSTVTFLPQSGLPH